MYAFQEKHSDKADTKMCSSINFVSNLETKRRWSRKTERQWQTCKNHEKIGIKQLVRLFDDKCGKSQHKMARKMKWTQFLVKRALKKKLLLEKEIKQIQIQSQLKKT